MAARASSASWRTMPDKPADAPPARCAADRSIEFGNGRRPSRVRGLIPRPIWLRTSKKYRLPLALCNLHVKFDVVCENVRAAALQFRFEMVERCLDAFQMLVGAALAASAAAAASRSIRNSITAMTSSMFERSAVGRCNVLRLLRARMNVPMP